MYIYKTQAYTHGLLFLVNCYARYPTEKSGVIVEGINLLKEALLNHRQDAEAIADNLLVIFSSSLLDTQDQKILSSIAHNMQVSEYTQLAQLLWENEFARRFESEIAAMLLKSPTQAMMEIVKKVSILIVETIKKNQVLCDKPEIEEAQRHDISIVLDRFYLSLTNAEDCIALGAFKAKPNFAKVEEILLKNSSDELHKIMHIHYKFAQYAFRRLPEVCTKQGRGSPVKQRVDAANINFYETPMFTASFNKGRKGGLIEVSHNYVDRLGIMLHGQNWSDLGTMVGEPKWVPDCVGQTPELDPSSPGFPIVRDMIFNDLPYVSGYSGMCSLLMPQMMILCDDAFEEQQRNYLCAVIAYITGGGFHNIHEVIAPCAVILEIIPGYLAQVPDAKNQALPPNYKLFFDLASINDDRLQEKINSAIQNYLFKFARVKIAPELSLPSTVSFSWPQMGQSKKTESSSDSDSELELKTPAIFRCGR